MRRHESPEIRLFNEDCLPAMRAMPDKAFDLAIVDPPYGLGKRLQDGGGKHKDSPFRVAAAKKTWDEKRPDPEYFDELFRVSRNQIICGGNYFSLPPTRGIISWDKKQMMPTFSRWEYLWSSFDRPAAIFEYRDSDANRIHPTQKPVALYAWLLKNYAEPGWRILDTHLGSGSIALACHDLGFDLAAYEKDAGYFKDASRRLAEHRRLRPMFM